MVLPSLPFETVASPDPPAIAADGDTSVPEPEVEPAAGAVVESTLLFVVVVESVELVFDVSVEGDVVSVLVVSEGVVLVVVVSAGTVVEVPELSLLAVPEPYP